MNMLSRIYLFKIAATIVAWCIPLLFFPATVLTTLGLPDQQSYMFIRLLGWAYLALCVGYGFGLRASLKSEKMPGPVYMGRVSNGGACVFLFYYGLTGEWASWGMLIQFIAWGSVVATLFITAGLLLFGVLDEKHETQR